MMTIENPALKIIPKAKSHAFGKDVYLLGREKGGARVWIEEPKWDCGLYWSWGYLETYQGDALPERARDISSHRHLDGILWRKPERYDFEKKAFILGPDYLCHWNDNPDLEATTLDEKSSWVFADLMKSGYTVKESAEVFYRGNSHLTAWPGFTLQNRRRAAELNAEIPRIWAAVVEILKPTE